MESTQKKSEEPRLSYKFDAVPEEEATQDELNRRLRKPGEPGYCPPVKKKDAPPRQQADTEADPTTGAKKS